jgi:hypothetical protein
MSPEEELLLQHGRRVALLQAAAEDAKPKPIIVPIKADEPSPPPCPHRQAPRVLH